MTARKPRLSWPPIIDRAAAITNEYAATGTLISLRQCFYRLVADGLVPNDRLSYNRLSDLSSKRRRDGTFPDFIDNTRGVTRPASWSSPNRALADLADRYARPLSEDQDVQVWVVVEKDAVVGQARQWAWPYGATVVALRGYSSRSLEREITEQITADGRPAVGLYVGDHDASGHDIERNLLAKLAGCGVEWKSWQRLAVTPDQVRTLRLSPAFGKEKDSRAARFTAAHGALIQVEVEAIPPDVLRGLVTDAVTGWTDLAVLRAVKKRTEDDRAVLRWLADDLLDQAGR